MASASPTLLARCHVLAYRRATAKPLHLHNLRATAATGLVLVLAVLGGFTYELARGQDGLPYIWLGFVGGVAYLGAVLWLRLRG